MLLEPLLASSGSLGIYLGNRIRGGAVAFERDDIDETAYLDELRRTVSDDGLLMEHLQVTTVQRTAVVPIGGTVRESIERHVRWTKTIRRRFSGAIAGIGLVSLFVSAGAVLFPLHTAVVLTAFRLAVNEVLGVRWSTALLGYPAVFVFVPLLPYALVRRTFVWGGRRYYWRSTFDVETVE